MHDVKAIAEAVIASVKGAIAAATAPLSNQLKALEARLNAVPAGPKGEKGDPGESIRGEKGVPGERGKDGAPGERGAAGERGLQGIHGEPGAAGQKGDIGLQGPQGAAGDRGVPGEPGARGEPGEKGATGERGADGSPGAAGIPGPQGEEGPAGARGEKGEAGPQGSPGADGREGKDGRDGREGKDGAPGRDALEIDILPGIEESKSYPRGTFAEHRGGVIRAIRNTDPITEDLAKAGWVVSMNGISDFSEEILDEGRTIKRTTSFTNGRAVIQEFKTSAILYREVWREGEYTRGDVVTWSGCSWHCQQKTTDKPGTSAAWKLMVKSGRDGKDAKPAQIEVRQPVKIA